MKRGYYGGVKYVYEGYNGYNGEMKVLKFVKLLCCEYCCSNVKLGQKMVE